MTAQNEVIGVEDRPGMRYFWPFAVEKTRVSLALQTQTIDGRNVPDGRGNPLQVSAVVTYSI